MIDEDDIALVKFRDRIDKERAGKNRHNIISLYIALYNKECESQLKRLSRLEREIAKKKDADKKLSDKRRFLNWVLKNCKKYGEKKFIKEHDKVYIPAHKVVRNFERKYGVWYA